jgi:leader peptidase (prepilin peptidase) / N-methyltransferase
MSTVVWAALAGALGVAAGGVSTAIAWRWPRSQPLLRGRARCGACGGCLRPHELVPLLSFVVLRGRCRACRSRIPAAYPAMELASGVLAATAVLGLGAGWRGLAGAMLGVSLVPVVAVDLTHRLIPDVVVAPAALAAAAAGVAADPGRWWVPLAGAAGGAAALLALSLARPEGMGLGDVKLAGLLGAALGLAVIPALLVAFAAGAVAGAVLLVRLGRRARSIGIPFAPFLAGGGLVGLWAGPQMLAWYAGAVL